MNDIASEDNVALDLLAIVDESPSGRLVGSEETTICEVAPYSIGAHPNDFLVTLDNGQQFIVSVRERPSALRLR